MSTKVLINRVTGLPYEKTVHYIEVNYGQFFRHKNKILKKKRHDKTLRSFDIVSVYYEY